MNMGRYSWMDLDMSEMKVRNEVPVPEPARISANEKTLQGAQEDLYSYSNYVINMFCDPDAWFICFIKL